jgi:histidine ammonia-lyase
MQRLLAGSPIVASHRYDDPRVQDAYSLRCAPQVIGAARDTVEHGWRVASAELVSAIDNPMVLPDGRVESCGNFHGAPLGYACDFLAIAAADVGAIAEHGAMMPSNLLLALPASVDSLPTIAMQEDHVSMAWGAARKLRVAVRNLRRILAVELVCAGRGIELRAPLKPGAGTGAALASLRTVVPGHGPDRELSPELRAAEQLLESGEFLRAVEAAVGELA